jgi:acetolactate synthase-1/2/3 large subunit
VETSAVANVPRIVPASPSPATSDLKRLQGLLADALRPIVIAGGSGWDESACGELVGFAERFNLPVATSFRRTSLFPADHPHYAGDLGIGPDPRLKARIHNADLIILIGGRLSEMASSSYTLLQIPVPQQKLVHVHPGAEELGRVYHAELAINATPSTFCTVLKDMELTRPRQSGEVALAHADYLDWSGAARELPGRFQYGAVVRWLSDRLPADAIICNGAGNYSGWLHRHFRFRSFGTQLAPTSGSMGYGVPAAVLAKLQYPERTVVAFAGDGCFLMNGQEFATAVQYDAPIIVVLVDNAQYGTIRMHQEREFPGRVVATQLRNPDFVAYARAFGGFGVRVEDTGQFAVAFEEALASRKPAIIHCLLDQRAQSHASDFEPTESKQRQS